MCAPYRAERPASVREVVQPPITATRDELPFESPQRETSALPNATERVTVPATVHSGARGLIRRVIGRRGMGE